MAYFHTAKVMGHAQELYKQYKEQWVRENVTDDMLTKTEAAYENDPDIDENMTFEAYVEEHGYVCDTAFHGICYQTFDEFLKNDYHTFLEKEKQAAKKKNDMER